MDCVFCKIAKKELPSNLIFEDEDFVAFRDINPIAPIHLLLIPRKHIPSVDYLEESDKELMGKLFLVAKKVAGKEGLAKSGYRLILNVGRDAGQTVEHLHLHLLGGKELPWTKL
ncbi:MAG: histidine triad nucleotide-binding protein [Candidatus Nealsonbacteria bacterium]|nr:histidine triad nucleotide-binding protein [Candidatus Nealsonbacteria bacterium]